MAVIRTQKLAGGQFSSSGTNTIYTCPTGKIALVKDIALSNLSSGGSTICAIEGRAADGSYACIFAGSGPSGLAGGDFKNSVGLWALTAGDTMFVYLPSGGNVGYWVSGVELSAS